MLSDDSRTFVGSLRSDVAVCVRSPCDEPHRARLNPGNGFPKKLIKPGGIGPKPPTRTGCGMAAFITHPSVRIKGTEHNYNPVLCQDDQCAASSKGSHMHCPFCSVTEAYQDPVILRAHYRVKHVDKGLDFAGLKVLRCCNHCEIVGTIKGEKKFKGAHWHCYRCRNGFNRRDEAVKHYKTHFRNPHTTFQIQITQDSSVSNGITVAAEETVGSSSSAHQTLVLMDSDGESGNIVYEDTANIVTEQSSEVLEQNLLLEKQLIELHQQNQQLQIEKAEMEKKLKAEIQQLKDHIVSVVQANVRMAEELRRYRSSEDIEKRISKMPEHGKLSYLQGVLRG
uniref:C2H2-type domain-containing protein n=1 Tax=Latimeria chalumnae TaxID=7897 RepID=M3XIV0_LATCH